MSPAVESPANRRSLAIVHLAAVSKLVGVATLLPDTDGIGVGLWYDPPVVSGQFFTRIRADQIDLYDQETGVCR